MWLYSLRPDDREAVVAYHWVVMKKCLISMADLSIYLSIYIYKSRKWEKTSPNMVKVTSVSVRVRIRTSRLKIG